MSEIDLAKAACLISVTIKLEGLLGERRDKQASSLVTTTYTVEESRAKASKYLINRKDKSVKGVIAAAQQVRAVVYRYTFPWGESNLRLLPAKAHAQFQEKMGLATKDLRDAIDRYCTHYPALVVESERELGQLFDMSQYPPTGQVRDMFRMSVGYLPMPAKGHFIADIANEAANFARETIVQQTQEATHLAVQDVVTRVERTVTNLIEGLQNYKPKSGPDGKVEGIFRDSLIANVDDIASLIGLLNFTEDPKLERLAADTARLARFTAETLRYDTLARSAVVVDAKALLGELESMKQLADEVDSIVDDMRAYI